jgi:hypothetical protein
MITKRILLMFIVVVGVGLSNSHLSYGQDIRTQLIDNTLKEKGSVLVVAFKNGLPAEGVVLRTPVGDIVTNSSGVASFTTSVSEKSSLKILKTKQVIEFSVSKDQETQITVHLLEDEDVKADVASPMSDMAQSAPTTGPPQDVRLNVLSQNGKPIEDATVLFSGMESVYKTSSQGEILGKVPPGTYSVSVFHPNYQTLTLTDVQVKESSLQMETVRLKEAMNELEDVVVLAPKVRGSVSALVEVRKQSSAVTDVLGSEQMARAGDSDAASSLRRVTGLTLVGGKYVYVRGLGERYSGVQMNQFSLPSPEPSRRVVPLDLFPTAIMESIVVQKSYTPDLPGEFGGGLIQLKTKSLPESLFFRANITSNYENINNRLSYQGGSTDWLGMDDGTRKLPDAIKNVLNQGKQITKNIPGFDQGLSEEQLVSLGRSLSNTYNTDRTDSPSLPGFSFSTGNGWDLSGIKLGVAGSALYGQTIDQFNRQVKAYNVGSGGKLAIDFDRRTEVTEIETRLAGSIDLGVDIYKHSTFRLSNFVLRNTTNLAQNDISQNFGSNGNFTDSTVLDFTERQLWTQHLKGEHRLEQFISHPVVLDWRAGKAEALRDSPDRREYLYDIINDNKSIASDAAGNRRTWSNLTDTSTELAFNITVPVYKSAPDFLKFKVGALTLSKERRSDITRLYFANDYSGPPPTDLSAPLETILDPENRKPGGFLLKNLTNSADTYSGEQSLNAQYIMTDFSPWEKWSFQAGVRRESSTQEVNTFKYFDPGNPFATSRLQMDDILPAYSLVWKPTEKIRGRVAYSETLARPDFRELSTVGFIDDETGNSVQGNANLKGTVIKNIDHRWEYYFTPDEYASVGVFYKNFENPIEVMFLPGVNRIQTFDNAKAANNFGFEFEGRMGLRHFSRTFRRFTFLSNLTLIRSEIELDERNKGIQTSSARPLQGQSPYVVNVQLQYDLPNKGFTSTVLYNIVGKRITEVGTNEIPDTYEQPFGQLDFVATKSIQKNWTVSLRARNLLDPEIESTQGDEIVRRLQRGRVFSLNLGAVF